MSFSASTRISGTTAEIHAGPCYIMSTACSSKLISNDCDACLSIQTTVNKILG